MVVHRGAAAQPAGPSARNCLRVCPKPRFSGARGPFGGEGVNMAANKSHISDAEGAARSSSPARLSDAEMGARMAELFIFNTDVRLFAYPTGGASAADPAVREVLDAALTAACERCRFFERTLSRTRADSDISRAHAASPAPVPVAPETAELTRLALAYGARSEGHFDITMGTVTSLWNFHTGEIPSRLALARALEHVGAAGRIEVGEATAADGSVVPTLAITDPATILDLGGIAKGYIADDLARIMREHGVGRFVLNLGGNVLVAGGRPGDTSARPPRAAGEPWRIGIVNPFDPAHHRALVSVHDGSVVTSGLFERSFTRGGVTYHHILDPQTGMPAQSDVASATIVAERSLDCDGWSTTALMMGAERARTFIEGLPGVEAVIIDDCDRVTWTSGLAERLSLIPTLPRL